MENLLNCVSDKLRSGSVLSVTKTEVKIMRYFIRSFVRIPIVTISGRNMTQRAQNASWETKGKILINIEYPLSPKIFASPKHKIPNATRIKLMRKKPVYFCFEKVRSNQIMKIQRITPAVAHTLESQRTGATVWKRLNTSIIGRLAIPFP